MEESLLTRKGTLLFKRMMQLPPDLPGLKKELARGTYTAEDVTKAAIQYLDNCSEEQPAAGGRHMPLGSPERHSTYVFELIQLLLQYGLEPNAVYDDSNVLWELQYVDNGYIAADTLALLLEHGGRVDLELDGEELFSDLDFSVMLDAFNQNDRQRYDGLVH